VAVSVSSSKIPAVDARSSRPPAYVSESDDPNGSLAWELERERLRVRAFGRSAPARAGNARKPACIGIGAGASEGLFREETWRRGGGGSSDTGDPLLCEPIHTLQEVGATAAAAAGLLDRAIGRTYRRLRLLFRIVAALRRRRRMTRQRLLLNKDEAE